MLITNCWSILSGKTLVHSWAEYRWGIFDEMGYPNDAIFPLFYRGSVNGGEQEVLPNYCSDEPLTGVKR